MNKIEIDLTEEQYQKMMAEMERGSRLNLNEETFSGYEIKLSVAEGGFAWVDFKMYNEVDLGDVNWRIV
jgi:hypothetical protein